MLLVGNDETKQTQLVGVGCSSHRNSMFAFRRAVFVLTCHVRLAHRAKIAQGRPRPASAALESSDGLARLRIEALRGRAHVVVGCNRLPRLRIEAGRGCRRRG